MKTTEDGATLRLAALMLPRPPRAIATSQAIPSALAAGSGRSSGPPSFQDLREDKPSSVREGSRCGPCRTSTDRERRCSIGSIGGANSVYGRSYMLRWQGAMSRHCLRWWIALLFAHIGRPVGQKGGAKPGNRPLARRTNHEDPCVMRRSRALYALLLTGGQVHDIHGARALLAAVPTPRCSWATKLTTPTKYGPFCPAREPTPSSRLRRRGVRRHHLTRRFTGCATSLSVLLSARTGEALQPVTTKKLQTSSPAFVSLQSSPTGSMSPRPKSFKSQAAETKRLPGEEMAFVAASKPQA